MTLYHIKSDWTKTVVSAGNDSLHSLSYSDINYQILLKNVYRIDGGTYMLSATNRFRVETQFFTVSITGECVLSRECVQGEQLAVGDYKAMQN